MTRLYYTPPSDECFEDLKKAAIQVWGQYDNTYHYVDEKVNQIKDIKNIKDNFMYIFAMFDIYNQRMCGGLITDDTRKAINERLVDGGSPEYLLL